MKNNFDPKEVFISYCQASDKNVIDKTNELAKNLKKDFIVHFDKFVPYSWVSEGWDVWMEEKIEVSRYVIVVCTLEYKESVQGKQGTGVPWENIFIKNYIKKNRGYNDKFLPIVFRSKDSQHVPEYLYPYNVYDLSDDDAFDNLMGLLKSSNNKVRKGSHSNDYPIGQVDCLTDIESQPQDINISIAYYPGDKAEKNILLTRINPIISKKKITVWSLSNIIAGRDIEDEINHNFSKSQIILVLISPEFIDENKSNHQNKLDVQRRIIRERLADNNGVIVPIILKDSSVEYTEFQSKCSLPDNGYPVSSWDNKEQAWTSISKGIELIINEEQQPAITMSGLQDFFCDDYNKSKLKKWQLSPALKDVDSTFIKPNFFDCLCLSLEESNHVVLIDGSRRSGKSIILNKAEKFASLSSRNRYKKYSCIEGEQRDQLFRELKDIRGGVIVIDDLDFLSPIEQKIILEHSLDINGNKSEILWVMAGSIDQDKLLTSSEYNGVYDQYTIKFFTYDSSQILKVISAIKTRFKLEIVSKRQESISRYMVNSIFIARHIFYRILENYIDSNSRSQTIYFENEFKKVFDQMRYSEPFSTFIQIENIFTKDYLYGKEFRIILDEVSKACNQDRINIRRLLKQSSLNFSSQELTKFQQYIEGHIAEISHKYPGFFSYEKTIQQLNICNIEFLFYLKNKSRFADTDIESNLNV